MTVDHRVKQYIDESLLALLVKSGNFMCCGRCSPCYKSWVPAPMEWNLAWRKSCLLHAKMGTAFVSVGEKPKPTQV